MRESVGLEGGSDSLNLDLAESGSFNNVHAPPPNFRRSCSRKMAFFYVKEINTNAILENEGCDGRIVVLLRSFW